MLKKFILFFPLFALLSNGAFFVFTARAENSGIIINEIAAYEKSSCEWVELYNRGSEAVDMEGWKFWEATTNHSLKISSSSVKTDWMIEPGEFAIITQDDENLFSSDCAGYSISAGTVFDSSWSTLNESGEEIGLKDAAGNFIEKFTYIMASNFSLQRKDSMSDDYSSANWVEHGASNSFGKANDFDVSPPPDAGTTSGDTSGSGGSGGSSGGTSSVEFKVAPAVKITPVVSKSKTILLNELLPNPYGADTNEFIELKNISDTAVDLKDWRLVCGSNTEYILTTSTLDAGKILLLKRSTTKLVLRNDKETIKLYDPLDKLVDETAYTEAAGVNWSWSVGKNNKWNWTTGATPGTENILVQVNRAPEILLDFSKEGSVGEILYFDASDSIDPNGDSLNFDWNFGDGGLSVGEMTQHIFFKSGTYKINLSVGDGHVTSTKQLIIKIKVPLVSEGETVNFQNESISVASEQKRTVVSAGKSAVKGVKIGNVGSVSLAEINNLAVGNNVTIIGVVTVLPEVFGSQYFYVTSLIGEKPAGVQVYLFKKDFPPFKVGDVLKVRGEISSANGEKRVKVKQSSDITVTARSEELIPQAVTLADMDENWPGTLVKVSGEITQALSSYWYVDDGSDEVRVTLKSDIDLDKNSFKNGDVVEVVGIARKINNEWEILPRGKEDIVKASDTKYFGQAEQKEMVKNTTLIPNISLQKYLSLTAIALGLFLGGIIIKMRGLNVFALAKEKISTTRDKFRKK